MFSILLSDKILFAPNVLTSSSSQTGSVIDRVNSQGAQLGISVGKTSGTPDSFTAVSKIYHCATSTGSFTQYTSNDTGAALCTVTAVDTTAVVDVDLRGAERYIKVMGANTFVNGTSPLVVTLPFVILDATSKQPLT